MMTQAEKTEAVINSPEAQGTEDWVAVLEAHARDLARKLDEVMVEVDSRGWPDYLLATRANIRAIIEPRP